MTRSIVLRVLIGLTLAHTSGAQSQHGAGISGGAFGAGVDASYIREHWGSPDSARLAAAVLWRGSPGWKDNGGAAVSAKLDSVRQAALRRHVVAGGTISATADAWVEYDETTRNVVLLGHSYALPHRDTAMVFLVDRVDHVGGQPTVSAITVACAAAPEVDLSSGRTELVVQGMRQMTEQWKACLRTDQRVADFLSHGSSR